MGGATSIRPSRASAGAKFAGFATSARGISVSINRSRAVKHLKFLKRTLDDLAGYDTLAYELIQNADDAKNAERLRFDIRDNALWVEDNGGFRDCGDQDLDDDDCPFLQEYGHQCDFHSFRSLSGADKGSRDDTTGAFGIGFTSVYQITDRPEILSGTRHWTVDETADENNRISEDPVDPPHEGTRIILPWARDPNSEFRRKASLAPVPEAIKDKLIETLDEVLAPAMLFLRNLKRIELSLDGDVVRVVTREVDGDKVSIDDGGYTQRWRILQGNFEDAAERLRAQHGSLIEAARKPNVAVAIPIGFGADGRLYATLPTTRQTELPAHVNAELYPTSDRRQLTMGKEHHRDWNTAAIDCAARLLAEALGELPALLGPERLWVALESARKLALTTQKDAVADALAAFWEHLKPEIPKWKLVWASDERWVTVHEALFSRSIEDEIAFPILERLGLALVHPILRPRQNILRNTQVRLLDIEDIAGALLDAGLDRCTPISELPEPLNDAGNREQLWSQIGRMIDHLPSDEGQTARTKLSTAAAVPSTDGNLCPIDTLWRTDMRTVELLSAVARGFPFLDHEQLPKEAEPLSSLCDGLTASGAITQLSAEHLQVDADVARELIGWFAQREQDMTDADRDALSKLPIFPSAESVHPLAKLALSGNFEDPLKLAVLVEPNTTKEYAGFLERLGIEHLSFKVYACDQIPRAFGEGQLSIEQRRAIVSLLAQRRGQLDDVPGAQPTLAALPLVECTDGSWQVAEDVYFDREAVRKVLGPQPLRPVLLPNHTLAVEELLAWLGVADEPRASDVVERIEEISRQAVNEPRREAVEHVVSWLGRRWETLEAGKREEFRSLRNFRWLPARGSQRWHAPDDLDLIFQDYLYASQGLFLDVSRSIQNGSAYLLRWLGLNDTPNVQQVVAHLRHCAENNTQPNLAVYGFLDNNAEDQAIQKLRGVECLLFDGQWRRPDEIYWSEHPFGQWRLQLPHEVRFGKLFDALGVKASPDYRDAMTVIADISARYTPYNEKVPDEDLKILRNCWELCEAALRREEVEQKEIAAFGKQKVIADQRGVLTLASDLYFEDLPNLADELPGIRDHVIQRPDGAWRAMNEAGVRDLSTVAVARIVDAGDRLDERLLRDRLSKREEELARVIAPRTAVPWRQVAMSMHELRLRVVTSMMVAWELDAFNTRFTGDPRQADALWQAQEKVLHVAVGKSKPVWEAVARELVRALLHDIEPATLALDIAAALQPDKSEDAKRSLDAAGFPSLAPEIRAEISTAIATDLDAEDTEQLEFSGFDAGKDTSDYEVEHRDEEYDDSSRQEHDSGAEGHAKVEDVSDGERSDAGVRAGSGSSTHQHGGDGDRRQSDDIGRGDTSVYEGGKGTRALSGRGSSTSQARGHLRSYVVRGDRREDAREADSSEQSKAVDEAGVEAVWRLEIEAGRTPETQAHNNPGYDVLSYRDGLEERYIEVKSTAGPWDEMGVGLYPEQFSYAQKLEDQFWLYVVEYALDHGRQKIWTIQNPAHQVTDFMFDDGWKAAAAHDGAENVDTPIKRRRITPEP